MFGRTRRKEAERFTRSVVAMRTEAHSLEALLEVLSQRINDSRSELVMISQHLMQLGDEATGKLGGITREFDRQQRTAGAPRRSARPRRRSGPHRHRRAARRSARAPRRRPARSPSRSATLGSESAGEGRRIRPARRPTRASGPRPPTSSSPTRPQRLAARLNEIESAGTAAVARSARPRRASPGVLDALLDRTSASLGEIRSAIDAQAAAVSALVAAGFRRASARPARKRPNCSPSNIDHANSSLENLSGRVAEQDRASQRMIAEIERGLALIDERFTELASHGDERANHFLESLTRARTELDTLAAQAGTQDNAIGALADRTAAHARERRAACRRDPRRCRHRDRRSARQCRPSRRSRADRQAGDRLDARRRGRGGRAPVGHRQPDRRPAGRACRRCSPGSTTASAIPRRSWRASLRRLPKPRRRPSSLTAETGPALVAALVQVKEAAAHAAERAREAIEAVIPESAGKLSNETREALERVIRESIEDRLARSRDRRRPRRRIRPRGVRPADPADADPRPERHRARAAYGADQQRAAREGQRSLRPARFAADRFDALGRDRRRQDPVRRNRRQGLGFLPQGQSRGVHPPRGAPDRRQRDPRDQGALTNPTSSSSARSTATSTISRRCFAASSPSATAG